MNARKLSLRTLIGIVLIIGACLAVWWMRRRWGL